MRFPVLSRCHGSPARKPSTGEFCVTAPGNAGGGLTAGAFSSVCCDGPPARKPSTGEFCVTAPGNAGGGLTAGAFSSVCSGFGRLATRSMGAGWGAVSWLCCGCLRLATSSTGEEQPMLRPTTLKHSALAQIVVAAIASAIAAELKSVFMVRIARYASHFSALCGGLQVRRF